MCFLKALKPLDEMTLERDSFTDDSSCQESPKNFPFGGCHLTPSFAFKAPQLSRQEQLLTDLMGFIHANNACLATLHQVHLLKIRNSAKMNSTSLPRNWSSRTLLSKAPGKPQHQKLKIYMFRKNHVINFPKPLTRYSANCLAPRNTTTASSYRGKFLQQFSKNATSTFLSP